VLSNGSTLFVNPGYVVFFSILLEERALKLQDKKIFVRREPDRLRGQHRPGSVDTLPQIESWVPFPKKRGWIFRMPYSGPKVNGFSTLSDGLKYYSSLFIMKHK